MADIDLKQFAAPPDDVDLGQFGEDVDLGQFADEPGYSPDKPIDKQHPDVSNAMRRNIMNIATTSPTAARYLTDNNFDVVDRGGYHLSVRKKGGGKWYVLDPNRPDWGDVTDVISDVTAGIATGVGAVVGAGAGFFPGGPVGSFAGATVGAAGAGALHEGAKQAIGAAMGFKPTTGEVLTGLGREAAIGAGGEVLGAGLKFGKGLVFREGSRATIKPAGTKTVAKAAEEVAENSPRNQAIDRLVKAADTDAIASRSRVEQSSKAVHTPAMGVPDATTDQLERIYAHQKWQESVVKSKGVDHPDYFLTVASQKGISPGEEVLGKASQFPREEFTIQEPQRFLKNFFGKFTGEYGETLLREKAAQAGFKKAWEKPIQELKDEIKRVVEGGDRKLFQDTLIDQRKMAWDLVNKSHGGAAEAIFVKNDGTLRQMYFNLIPPVTTKAASIDLIKEMVHEDVATNGIEGARKTILNMLRSMAREKVVPGTGIKIGAKTVTKSELKEAATATEERLAELVFKAQKLTPGGKGILSYNPKNVGTRIVWDIEKRGWSSVPLDKLIKLRTIDPATGKIGQDLNFLANPELLKSTGLAHAVGKAMVKAGAYGQIPGKIAEKVGEVVGIPPIMKKYLRKTPYAGVLTGGPIGKTVAGVQLGADVLQAVGRRLMHDRGDLVSKALRSPFDAVQKAGQVLQKTLNKDGLAAYRAMAYVLIRQTPGLADALLST